MLFKDGVIYKQVNLIDSVSPTNFHEEPDKGRYVCGTKDPNKQVIAALR